jgi:indolepyruvate ferredoxin oxidoreductase
MGINQGPISLDQKYTQGSGHVFLTGIQALVRLPMAQIRRDRAAGLNTAGFVTGYRGSPLGGYDQQLFAARKHLEQYNIKFQPGVNEDLAATAIWGSQQLNLSPGARHDGVVSIWYGKGPGVDRCGDVFRHGNAAGSAKNGGVLCLAGDDHGAKSSTVPHQSDHAFISALMPYLYPSSIHEMIEMGLLGIAMSRYSGCWVGMKVITETVETTAEIDLTDEMTPFIIPSDFEMPPGGLNLRWPDDRYDQDRRLQDYKGFAAIAFARANKVNRVTMDSPNARFGIMASGKSYEDIRQALRELGVTPEVAAKIGLRLYKIGMPWPLEPEGVRQFAVGLEEILIIEERREIVENQVKQELFNWRDDVRPRIVGKMDEHDKRFRPSGHPDAGGGADYPHAVFLLGLSAQHLDQGARGQPRLCRHRLPLHGAVDGSQHRNLHPYGRRGRAVGGCCPLHRRKTRVREPRRRHLFPFGQSRDPSGGLIRRQHHLQDPL